MKLTGRNIQLVWLGLNHGLSDLHNEIATCPNVFEHAKEIEEIRALMGEFERLALRIENSKDFTDPPEIKSL